VGTVCVGVQVKLCDRLTTRAISERFYEDVRLSRGAILSSVRTFASTFTGLTPEVNMGVVIEWPTANK